MSTVKDYTPTQDVQNAAAKFSQLDDQFKNQWTEHYERNRTELDQLEQLRESRNVTLDEVVKMLRIEAQRLDPKRYKTIKYGPFQVSKKNASDFFRPEEFVQLAKTLGFEKKMREAGVIKTKVEVDYKGALEFLKDNALDTKFATTLEGGAELTPSVTGPKAIPALGQEAK
jgi:hypothetical protein